MNPIPERYAVRDLLVFGDRLTVGTWVARGMVIELPDTRGSDHGTQVRLREQALAVLGALGPDYALQWQWSVEPGYGAVLGRYQAATAALPANSWGGQVREERFRRYWRRRCEGRTRRERLVVYLATRGQGLPKGGWNTVEKAEAWLAETARSLGDRLQRLGGLFHFARCRLLGDADHLSEAARWYNPSQNALSEEAWRKMAWRADWSVAANCFWGDGYPLRSRREDLVGVYFDQHYHTLLVLRDWPKQTQPGMVHALTEAVGAAAALTVNLYPLDVGGEIKRLEEERAELLKQVDDPKKHHLRSEVERKGKKIAALMEGQGLPYRALWVLRLWDRTVEGLSAKCVAAKAALQGWTGCRYHQVDHEMQASALFGETTPGWLGEGSRGWDVEGESTYLADLLPLSSSFVGHAEEASVLLDNRQGGLVGLRLFSAGTPQHACLVGMRGAGKSSVTLEVLGQTEHEATFTGIIEEGLSYGTYAQLNGYQTLILRPGAPYTWNYFDTQGLPLGPTQLAEATALLVRLAGGLGEQGRVQAALLNEYLRLLYDGVAEDWERRQPHAHAVLVEQAWWAEQVRQRGAQNESLVETWWRLFPQGEVREEERRRPSEGERSMFLRRPGVAASVRSLVFSRLKPEEFPTHRMLCAVLRSARLPHHRSAGTQRELDVLATLLQKWTAEGGVYGPLVDGVTNVTFQGRGLHVELGYLGDENRELKEVAGFLATSQMRKRVVGLPRAAAKRMVYEEVAKFLTVPGAADLLAENYAQFRKYRCWVLTVFQNAEQLSRADPALLRTLRANSTQFWFMRHQDAESLRTLGDAVGLPEAARREIMNFPLPEHQRGPERGSYFSLWSRDGEVPVAGSVRVEVSPPVLYVATSSGETFDERTRWLSSVERPLDALLQRYPFPTHEDLLPTRAST